MNAKFEDTIFGQNHAKFVKQLVDVRKAVTDRAPAMKDRWKATDVIQKIEALLDEIEPGWNL